MATHSTLDTAAFRVAFPEFADTTAWPDTTLEANYTIAADFIDNNDNFCGGMSGATLERALQLFTAHLCKLSALIASGTTPTIVQASSVDKVSVTLVPPPVKTQWQYWLATTPYGQQLLALLSVLSVGGWTVGGIPERRGFRKGYGIF